MSRSALGFHVVFAVLALAFAWVATRDDAQKGGPTSVVLLDASLTDIDRLEYRWPKGASTVTVENGAPVVVVDREREPTLDKKTPDGHPPIEDEGPPLDDPHDHEPAEEAGAEVDAKEGEAQAASGKPEREQVGFPGGRATKSALAALAPLRTKRTLGAVDAARLKSMGLEKPERTLVVATKKGTLTLDIGEAAYGGQGRYARKQGDDVVHLIETQIVGGLEGGAETLMEKRLLVADLEEIVAFEVRLGDQAQAFVHVDREQPKKRRFAPSHALANKAEAADTLIKTLRDARAQRLVEPGVAGSSVLAVAVQLTEDRPAVRIELLERTDGEGHVVRYEGFLASISQTNARELLDDATAALGGASTAR